MNAAHTPCAAPARRALDEHLRRLPALLCLVACLLGAATAQAQSAANGQALYNRVIVSGQNSCSNPACHGAVRDDSLTGRGANANVIKTAFTAKSKMTFLNGRVSDAEVNDLAAYIAGAFGTTPTYIAITSAPAASVSSSTLTFASQDVGTTSAAQTVTLTNGSSATAALTLSGISITSGSDFSVSGGTCTATTSLAAGASCSVGVVFRPTAAGTRSGTLTLAHNGANGRSEVSLSGAAVSQSPAVSLSPTTLTFSSAIGRASSPLRVTVSNTGTASLALSSLTLGGAQASDYALAGSSTCAANGAVAGGSSCVIDVVFTPGAVGARSGVLTIAHNAGGSPSTVTLAGTGTASPQPGLALDATALDLGSQVVAVTSGPRTLTVTNSGGANLTLGSIATSGTNSSEFVLGGTCAAGTTLAANAACTITVAMRPLTLGLKLATLSIASNAPTGTASVALRGTSVNTPAPEIDLSQVAVGFGSVTFGTRSMARTVRLTNSGTAALAIGGIASTSSEFEVTHDCPASLAVNAACTLSTVYTPVTANSAESIFITTNALSSPNSIVLTGWGTAASLPVLSWQPNATALNFASTVVGVSSASQSLTLVNNGPGAVTLNSLGVAGTHATSFALASSSTCRAGLSLAASASCNVVVTFVPGSTGTKTANLQIASTGTPPGDVVLTGSGASPGSGNGTLTLSQTTLDFSSVGVVAGQASSPLAVSLSNGSTAPVTISSIQANGPFALATASSNACPTGSSTLAAGAACNLAVVYTPSTAGTSTGTITIVTGNQTLEVSLLGQATSATPRLAWQPGTSSLAFSSTAVGATSAVQTLTLSNQGPGSATLSALRLNGTDSAAFTMAGSSTCRANTSLAAGTTCTIALNFAPASTGAKTATLRVESNATAPGDVVLSGTGSAPSSGNGTLSVDRSTLDFGNQVALGQTSPAMNVVVSNNNVAAVSLSRVEVTGPFRISNSNCPASSSALAVNASCTLGVAYAPTSSGAATGSLTLTTATNQVLVVSLLGSTPASTATPVLVWTPSGITTLSFAATAVGQASVTRLMSLINQGPGLVNFTAIEPSGAHGSSFAVDAGSTCRVNTPLQLGDSCTVVLSFRPNAAGTKTASLRIASNASAPPTLTLVGEATGGSGDNNGAGALTVDSSDLVFMAAVNSASQARTVTVTNSGNSALTLSGMGTTGPFQVVNSASNGCANPQVLQPGAACTLSVVFNGPGQTGTSSGTLSIPTTTGDTRVIRLSGTTMLVNAGGTENGEEKGAGALGPLWLALLALAVVASACTRRRRAE